MTLHHTTETLLRTLLIGAGATVAMDLWALLLRAVGVRSLDFALLGRWLGHLPRQWRHTHITQAKPVRGERLLGWCAHYAIGISFAALLLALVGLPWARTPSWPPALAVGVATVVAPLFVLQPALGLGIASARTRTPVFNALKSVATHTVFGCGLYLAALATAGLVPAAA